MKLRPAGWFAPILLTGCLLDGSYRSPYDERNLRPLGAYVATVSGTDTVAVNRIFRQADNPRLAVMWRSVETRDDFTPGQSSIDLKVPFVINLTLLHPPPEKVLRAREISFGLLTLYMDANGNGLFDRTMHPDMRPAYDRLDSLGDILDSARAAVFAEAEIRPRSPVCETLYVDAGLDVVEKRGGALDTVWRFQPGDFDPSADDLPRLGEYTRLLGMQNRWERFFAQRKKDNEFYQRGFPMPGWLKAVEVRYDRALWPKAGRENAFWKRVRPELDAYDSVGVASLRNYARLASSGMWDYPFLGYGERGADWIAGRVITDLLLFLPDQAALDTLRAALPGSTFRIYHPERARVGYNLFHCDDQYVCDVKLPGDTIQVIAGSSELYFNAPPSKPRDAFGSSVVSRPTALPASALSRLEGAYALNGSDTLAFAVRDGRAWCWFPGEGLRRVLPADSNGFFDPRSRAQGLFTAGLWGNPDRMIQYADTLRFAYARVASGAPAWLLDRIDRVLKARPAAVAESLLARYPGAYLYGADTLKVRRAGGDSLTVSWKGHPDLGFFPVSDTAFRTDWGDWTLDFPACGSAGCASLNFGSGDRKKNVPRAAESPSNRLTAAPEPTAGPLWALSQAGTGRDDAPGIRGRGRYACSQDGTFLKPGDGILEGFSRAQPWDGISLREGGDAAWFRIEGMRGKRAVLELRACADKDAKGRRIRVSVWGGSDRERVSPLPEGQAWLDAAAGGSYWTVDSIPVDSDPYFLRVVEEDTRDAPVFNAFSGYRLGERP